MRSPENACGSGWTRSTFRFGTADVMFVVVVAIWSVWSRSSGWRYGRFTRRTWTYRPFTVGSRSTVCVFVYDSPAASDFTGSYVPRKNCFAPGASSTALSLT